MLRSNPNVAASNADFEFEALQQAKNYRAALIKEFSPYLGGNVIEIGAGIGQMTESLINVPGTARLLSVEPDDRLCDGFKSRLPAQALLRGTIHDVPRDAAWNAIVSINVLEHIEHDENELRAYREILEPSRGHLCLFIPARPEIYAPLDRDFGHHRRYTRRGLSAKLESAGFEILHLNYFNLVGYFAWGMTFCVLKRRKFNPGGVRLFDQLLFPPTNWIEHNILRPPFGQSLLAVARSRKHRTGE
jgi:hypothetical protein